MAAGGAPVVRSLGPAWMEPNGDGRFGRRLVPRHCAAAMRAPATPPSSPLCAFTTPPHLRLAPGRRWHRPRLGQERHGSREHEHHRAVPARAPRNGARRALYPGLSRNDPRSGRAWQAGTPPCLSIRSRGRASVRGWLYQIATNRALDALRATRRRPEDLHQMTEIPEPSRYGEAIWLPPSLPRGETPALRTSLASWLQGRAWSSTSSMP